MLNRTRNVSILASKKTKRNWKIFVRTIPNCTQRKMPPKRVLSVWNTEWNVYRKISKLGSWNVPLSGRNRSNLSLKLQSVKRSYGNCRRINTNVLCVRNQLCSRTCSESVDRFDLCQHLLQRWALYA